MKTKHKSAAAVELGRKGGRSRGKKLSRKELTRIGKQGAAARWTKKGGK
jgi:hypothetical protein